jgi:type I restriction enzyme S subunit
LVETIVPARDKPLDLTGPIPWVRIEDFDGKWIAGSKSNQGVWPEAVASMPLRLFPPGTVVCTCSCDMGTTAVVQAPLVTNQTFIGLRPRTDALVPDYLYYSLQAHRPQLNAQASGAIQAYLSRDDFRQLRLPIPPPADQIAIAQFLDAKTSRIDNLLIAKARLTSLLHERRRSTTRAGLAGLLSESQQSLVPSALPWLDCQPRHWQTVKLGLVAQLGSGHTPSRDHPEWWQDCTIPWITTGEVAQMRADRIEYITATRENISEVGLANSSATVHPAGTVVLCRTAASAGYSAIMGADMATSQDLATWTCGPKLDPRFLLLCLRAMRADLLERLAQGSTHKTIYMPDIESIRVPLPPLDEQRLIVDQTWEKLLLIDDALDRLSEQVNLLREHRTALITAAVVGELGVGVAASS